MNIRLITAILLASVATGCSVTPDDLRGESGRHFQADIDGQPQQVYERIIERLKPCIQRTSLVVDSDYLAASQRALIVARATHDMGAITIFDAEIKRTTPNTSMLNAYYYRTAIKNGDAHRPWLDSMTAWGQGKDAPCPF